MSAAGRVPAPRQMRAGLAPVTKHVGEASALLKALVSEPLLLVRCSLLEGPPSFGEIDERVPLSQPALSQHLAVLRGADIVTTRRESQTIRDALAPCPVHEIMAAPYTGFCARGGGPPRRPRKG